MELPKIIATEYSPSASEVATSADASVGLTQSNTLKTKQTEIAARAVASTCVAASPVISPPESDTMKILSKKRPRTEPASDQVDPSGSELHSALILMSGKRKSGREKRCATEPASKKSEQLEVKQGMKLCSESLLLALPCADLASPKARKEHNKVRAVTAICEHGEQRRFCKEECGDSGICEYRKRKIVCKECGGSGTCEYSQLRQECKECGGSGICVHGERKSHCKDCGGSAFCEHCKRKNPCNESGGSGMCEHGKQRQECQECLRPGICAHGKRKSYSKNCRGSGIC